MKILMFSGYPLSGKTSGSLESVAKLAQSISSIDDMKVHLVSLGDRNERLQKGNITVHLVNKMWFLNPFSFPFALWWMKRIAENINPDVVHALRGFPYFNVTMLLKKKYPVLFTFFSLSTQELHFEKSLFWLLARILVFIPTEQFVIPKVSDITVQSSFMESLIRRRAKGKIHIVSEGIDYERIRQFKTITSMEDPPDIFIAVNFRKLKGIDLIIKAIPEVIRSVPEISVYIAGSGEEESNLKALVKELGIENRIKFLGFVSDETEKYKYYQACKIVVAPSRWDNEPFAPMDGAVFGKPAIVSDAAHSSVVVDGKTGFVFHSENVEELAGKIIKLLTDDKLRKDMGRAIQEKVKEYDWPNIAGKTLEIYKQVIVDFQSQQVQNKGY